MLNRIILIGRLTRDPEQRFTPANGVPVTNFTIAVDRPFVNQKGEREADFIRIVTWRKLAETCANHLSKGRLVAVDGRLQIRSYEGQDGQRRYMTEVV
ncbi:MAG TPA: single-stranded DNA-binding protein, partial [Thermoanaerobacterales bacterium]|nr:single-stranded DNA-binding protein [Thermoanaerobacterales bacterium]